MKLIECHWCGEKPHVQSAGRFVAGERHCDMSMPSDQEYWVSCRTCNVRTRRFQGEFCGSKDQALENAREAWNRNQVSNSHIAARVPPRYLLMERKLLNYDQRRHTPSYLGAAEHVIAVPFSDGLAARFIRDFPIIVSEDIMRRCEETFGYKNVEFTDFPPIEFRLWEGGYIHQSTVLTRIASTVSSAVALFEFRSLASMALSFTDKSTAKKTMQNYRDSKPPTPLIWDKALLRLGADLAGDREE